MGGAGHFHTEWSPFTVSLSFLSREEKQIIGHIWPFEQETALFRPFLTCAALGPATASRRLDEAKNAPLGIIGTNGQIPVIQTTFDSPDMCILRIPQNILKYTILISYQQIILIVVEPSRR